MADPAPLFTQSGDNTESREWTLGYQGLFKITLVLNDNEREIDVDERGALVFLRLEMQDTGSFGMNVLVKRLALNVAFRDRSILINGHAEGEVPVIEHKEREEMTPEEHQARLLTPDGQIERELTIQTGVFSSTETPKNAPARSARRQGDRRRSRLRHGRGDEDEKKVTKYATMIFLVADD